MYLQITGTNVRILGSMHLFPGASPELPKWVCDAYDWSESLVFEADAQTFLPFCKSVEPTNLQSLLKPEVWNVLESIWPNESPVSPLSLIYPWAVLLLAPSFCMKVSNGVEPHFTEWASRDSKPVDFFETAQDIARAFESVPITEVLEALKLFALDISAPQATLSDIYTAWLSRDLAAVYVAASRSPTFAYPSLRSAVLELRNRAWLPSVKQMLGVDRRTLIVVGALHLYGPNNLIQLLDKHVVPVQI